MIVAGDIGGTKCVLAAVDAAGRVVREQRFVSAEHATFESIVDAFVGGDAFTAACFGVAGPIDRGVARLTNLPWVIDAQALGGRLGKVELLNDLQATALGMLDVDAAHWQVLQAGEPVAGAPIAVIAPGTGLGEALLVPDAAGRYRALASEGGHADYAPSSDADVDLLHFLAAKYGGHVSYERVLCGNGIGDAYLFWRGKLGTHEPAWLTEAIATGDRNAVVTDAALAGKDEACVRALDMFAGNLAAEAGNMALRALATAGVYIGGGIPPRVLAVLARPDFVTRFRAKGRFADLMARVPVRVCLEPKAALLGAVHRAREL